MNQIKPYLFWIICAVLLLVLLVLGLFVLSPSDQSIDGTARDAYQVKDVLDADSKRLQALSVRAKRGDPSPPVFDPQVKGDIDTLTKDYLLTKEWKGVIDPHVEKYDQQLKALRQDLIDRSAILRKEISIDHGKNAWYRAYESVTAEVVTRLRAGRALKVPESTRRAFSPAAGSGLPGAGVAGPDDSLDPNKGGRIREVLGFITTTDLPDPAEHDLLTKRFRIVEVVAGAVLAADAEALPNPMVGPASPVRAPAQIAAWEWKNDGGDKLEGELEQFATPIRCTVSLQGSEAALTAALARLESLDRPVLIVLGSTFSRIERAASGSRKPLLANGDAVIAAAAMTIDVLVLDFGQMPDLTSVAAPAGEASSIPVRPAQEPVSAPEAHRESSSDEASKPLRRGEGLAE